MPDADVEPDLASRLAKIDLNLLPPLLALLQEHSVSAAAARLNLSQPAMSHALGRLRRLFQDELLVRVGQRLELTPRAVALVEKVQGSLVRFSEEVLGSPAFDPAMHRRLFTLAMTPSTASVVSPVLLRVAEQEAPGVSFHVVESPDPGVEVFSRSEVDLALIADIVAVAHPRTTLYVDRWVVVVDRSNESVGQDISLDDLARLPHIAYRAPSMRTQPYVALEAAGIHPRYLLVSSNFLLIPILVTGTDAVAIVQERLARNLADGLGLRILEFPLQLAPLGIDVVENPRMRGDSGVAWLTGVLHREFTR
jgi:DNA-binding transcriptional LysR family regulator